MCGFPCCCCKPVMQIDDHFLTENLWKCYLGWANRNEDTIQDRFLHWTAWRPHPTDWAGVDSEFVRPDSFFGLDDKILGAVLKHWKSSASTITFEVGMEYRFRGPYYASEAPSSVYPSGTIPDWTYKTCFLAAHRLLIPPRSGTTYVDPVFLFSGNGNDHPGYLNFYQLGLEWIKPADIGGGGASRRFEFEDYEFPESGEIRVVLERDPSLGARMQVIVNGAVNRITELDVDPPGTYRDWTTYSPASWAPINDYWRASWDCYSAYAEPAETDPGPGKRYGAIDRVYGKSY